MDHFFHQWIWRAGAPKYEVSYTYDDAAHQVKLNVKQTQKVEGMVDLFDMPVEVEIATASGHKTYPIVVSKEEETFTLPADSAPLMVIFDKGDNILKSVEFKKGAAGADLSIDERGNGAGPGGRGRGVGRDAGRSSGG